MVNEQGEYLLCCCGPLSFPCSLGDLSVCAASVSGPGSFWCVLCLEVVSQSVFVVWSVVS